LSEKKPILSIFYSTKSYEKTRTNQGEGKEIKYRCNR